MLIASWPRRFQLPLKLIFLVILSIVVFGEIQLYRAGVGVGSGPEPAFFMLKLPRPALPSTSIARPTPSLSDGRVYSSVLKAQQSEGGSLYAVRTAEGSGTGAEVSFKAHNPAQELELRFDAAGVYVATAGEKAETGWRMHLRSIDYATDTHATSSPITSLPTTFPVGQANRIEYTYNSFVTEWYINGPLGLEQGFELSQPPIAAFPTSTDQPLRLEIGLDGATSQLDKDGSLLILQTSGTTLHYGQLLVTDATGQTLPAHLETTNGGQGFVIVVDERGAVYPLTIDPLIQQAKLLSADPTPYAAFGSSVALSADGNTALVGASGPSSSPNSSGAASRGAAYVLTRSGNEWGLPVKLQPTDSSDYDSFGAAVALSADGNIALIGSDNKTGPGGVGQGKAYIFTRPNGSAPFTNASQIDLLAADGAKYDTFGIAVALSGDGMTALVGAYNQNNGGFAYNGKGAAYVFNRTAGTPFSTSLQTKLTASDAVGTAFFGISVVLSSDGNLALIGAPGSSAAYAYSRLNSTTTYSNSLQSKITVGGTNSYSLFGSAVALAGDGNTALVGAPGDNSFQGAAYVLTRTSGSTFITTTNTKLVASDPSGTAQFGSVVALSSDSNSALAATNLKTGPGGTNQGAAYFFTRPNSTTNFTSTTQTKLLAPDGATSDHFGNAAALSTDGNTVLVGAFTRSAEGGTAAGAAYVFAPALPLSLTLQSAPNPARWGESVVFTATLSGQYAGGASVQGQPVSFLDGTSLLGTSNFSASGVATFTTSSLSTGLHEQLTAVYTPTASPQLKSNALTQTIQPAPSATGLTVSPIPATVTQTITMTASVSIATNGVSYSVAPTGTLAFYANTTLLATLPLEGGANSVVYTTTLPGGTYNLYATYSGNLNFTGSTSPGVREQVSCASLVVTLASDGADPFECGSFSSALALANKATEPVTITFAPSITSVTLTKALAERVANQNGFRLTVDGGCKGGGRPGVGLVAGVAGSEPGLVLGSNVWLDGLSFGGFSGYAVSIEGSNNLMTCSYVGLTPDGGTIVPNSAGVRLVGSANGLGRSDDPASGNVIVGNSGLGLLVSSESHGDQLYYNLIGVLPPTASTLLSPTNLGGAISIGSGGVGLHIGQSNRFKN